MGGPVDQLIYTVYEMMLRINSLKRRLVAVGESKPKRKKESN